MGPAIKIKVQVSKLNLRISLKTILFFSHYTWYCTIKLSVCKQMLF